VRLSASQVALMSQLLDEALPLDEAGRRLWLEHLSPNHKDLADALRRALLPDVSEAPALAAVSGLPNLEAAALLDDGVISDLKPGARLGPYELIRSLGAGGMAEVWLGRRADGAFRREVALKLPIRTHLRADLEQRFARERDILASLEHPHIARLYDAGTDSNGLTYLSMEYVQGQPLTDWCDSHRLGVSARLKLFLQVLEAVQYAHEKRVIHRDLKPSNILVTEAGQVRLLDFGVAKLLEADESERTQLTSVYGRALTPDYASPELLRGDPIDAPSDTYSLGVLLYELLTGVRPYQLKRAASMGLLQQGIAAIEVIKPSAVHSLESPAARGTTQELTRQLRGDLDAIAVKALAKDPALRYQSAAAFAQDLQRYLEGKPIQAQPMRFQYRLRKFVERNRVPFAVSAAALLMASASIVYSLYRGSHPATVKAEAGSVPALPLENGTGTPNPATDLAAPVPAAHSLAVLPFIDLSEAKDQEYFSDGLAEELLDLLTKVAGLHVTARTSSFSFKGKSDDIPTIARKLNVANILEGSVRKSGNRLRVSAQLIDASNGDSIWSDTYERQLQDVFLLQDEIAGELVSSLKLKLASGHDVPNAKTTSSVEAHNQYLLARHFFDLGSLDGARRSAAAYRKAIALDPRYAAAYAGLSSAEFWESELSRESEFSTNDRPLQAAMSAAETAIALAPEEAEGYTARAFLRYEKWDWPGAQADLDVARTLNPGSSTVQHYYGMLLGTLGRLPEAIVAQRKDVEMDPLAALSWYFLGESLISNGEFAAAHEALDRSLEIDPGADFGLASTVKLELIEGRALQALAVTRQIKDPIWNGYCLAATEHALNHARESDQALDRLIAKYSQRATFQIAELYAWRGESDKALEWLERAYRQHDPGTTDIKTSPMLSNLRDEPRFKALLEKMNLPE
jgi:serine/threonine protein kinase/Tfp pilus assembly protein PilF